ncbi:Hypothetical protein MLTONO_p0273 (plasmid) [Mesorhizobium loti]|nr:Hypothetical protein MLTONO_p0273 [Mesorhizobium loti]
MEWDLETIENAQEFMLAAMQPGQRLNRCSKRARSAAALGGMDQLGSSSGRDRTTRSTGA